MQLQASFNANYCSECWRHSFEARFLSSNLLLWAPSGSMFLGRAAMSCVNPYSTRGQNSVNVAWLGDGSLEAQTTRATMIAQAEPEILRKGGRCWSHEHPRASPPLPQAPYLQDQHCHPTLFPSPDPASISMETYTGGHLKASCGVGRGERLICSAWYSPALSLELQVGQPNAVGHS